MHWKGRTHHCGYTGPHKKGGTLDPANYRPTAVGDPLYRLYTVILNARLVNWSEKHGLRSIRSPSQAGVRPGRSTVHRYFAPRHFIDHAKQALYTRFVGLQKAYDTFQHDLLWGRLRQIGVRSRMLPAFQFLYATRTSAMKIDGTTGQPAVQHMGVQQVCPLSPTLFGIFFDGLHDYMLAWAPAVVPQSKPYAWPSRQLHPDKLDTCNCQKMMPTPGANGAVETSA